MKYVSRLGPHISSDRAFFFCYLHTPPPHPSYHLSKCSEISNQKIDRFLMRQFYTSTNVQLDLMSRFICEKRTGLVQSFFDRNCCASKRCCRRNTFLQISEIEYSCNIIFGKANCTEAHENTSNKTTPVLLANVRVRIFFLYAIPVAMANT